MREVRAWVVCGVVLSAGALGGCSPPVRDPGADASPSADTGAGGPDATEADTARGDVAPPPDVAPLPDAAPDVPSAADVPVVAVPRCNPTAAFGPAMPLTTLNTESLDEGARLSPDELTLYFSSNRSGGLGRFDVYLATRSNLAEAFGNVRPVPGVNTAGVERWPSVTADGLALYALTGAGAEPSDIVVASRSSVGAPFGPLAVAAGLNDTTNDSDAYATPDHTAIYFASDRGGTSWDIYRAARTGGQVRTPVRVNAVDVNSGGSDTSPVVTPDELVLYFASANRLGGAGGYDVMVATRESTADPFGPATTLASVNTAALEVPNWISADNCVLYFTRTVGATGHYDLYVATRGR